MERAYHIPVLLNESVNGLEIKENGDYVDVTFGGGGHSREIFSRLKSGRLFAFDQDKDATANVIHDDRFFFIRHNFKYIRNFLKYYDVEQVDGILADLGVSSHDFDVAERGFSFRFDGPLDMRMDTTRGFTAMEWLESATEQQIREVLKNHGEERHAVSIAQALVARRALEPLRSTGELAALVADVHRACRQRPEPGQDPATAGTHGGRPQRGRQARRWCGGVQARGEPQALVQSKQHAVLPHDFLAPP